MDTTNTDRSASYLELHIEIDSMGRLRTKLYNKRDNCNLPIVNFQFLCSNISTAPACGPRYDLVNSYGISVSLMSPDKFVAITI